MKKPIIRSFYLSLLIILLITRISGGDEFAKYKVIAKKPNSIATVFYVYSDSEENAKEEVALNGWQIISIEKVEDYKNGSGYGDLKGSGSYETLGRSENPNNNFEKEKLKKNYDDFKNLFEAGRLRLVKVFYFDKGKFEFPVDNQTIEFIKSLDKNKIYFIYGHTDSLPVKPNKFFKNNYELSILRAKFVKKLIEKYVGIDSEHLKIVGFGEFYPAVSNGFDGAKKNRRVEIYELRD